MDLASGRCVACEALTRWRRDREVCNPFAEPALLADVNLCGRITYWVIETVARELGAWLRANEVHLSISVPPQLLGRGGISHVARGAGLIDVAHKLILEITEHGVPDVHGIAAVNSGRHESGARIAIDDASLCGSANLLVFSRLNVDILKLGYEAPLALTALLQATRAQVIVEGVETAEQAQALRDLGVTMAQGWHFSRSLTVSAFLAYYKGHQ